MCDNGTQFTGTKVRKLYKKYQIKKIWWNAYYHPQVNFTERSNLTIGTAIRSFIEDNQRYWDKHLAQIQQAFNSEKHEVTGFSPALMNFARHAPISGRFYDNVGDIAEEGDLELFPDNRETYAASVKKRMVEIFQSVQEKLHNSYKRNQRYYNDKRRPEFKLEVVDKVWKRNGELSDATRFFSAKLAPRFVLCVVRKKISPIINQLNFAADNTDAGIWHMQDLKPYVNYQETSGSSEESSEDED